jgi:hypothetical protein
MNTKEKIKEAFCKKFTDKWDNGLAVCYPQKEGVAEIIPAEDLWNWIENTYRPAVEREVLEKVEEYLDRVLYDCAGCTYDKDEGTHAEFTKQHYKDFLLHSPDKGKQVV